MIGDCLATWRKFQEEGGVFRASLKLDPTLSQKLRERDRDRETHRDREMLFLLMFMFQRNSSQVLEKDIPGS